MLASSADSTIRRSAGFPAVFVSVVGEMAAASPSGAHDADTIIKRLVAMAGGEVLAQLLFTHCKNAANLVRLFVWMPNMPCSGIVEVIRCV